MELLPSADCEPPGVGAVIEVRDLKSGGNVSRRGRFEQGTIDGRVAKPFIWPCVHVSVA